MDDEGNYAIFWADLGPIPTGSPSAPPNYAIRGQRFDARHQPVGEPYTYPVNSSTLSGVPVPAVAMDADGDFVVSWFGTEIGAEANPCTWTPPMPPARSSSGRSCIETVIEDPAGQITLQGEAEVMHRERLGERRQHGDRPAQAAANQLGYGSLAGLTRIMCRRGICGHTESK